MSEPLGTTTLQLPSELVDVSNYVKKRIGSGINNLEITDEQIADRIMDAFQFFSVYNDNGIERVYQPHSLTQTDLENSSIPTANNVLEVIRVLMPNNIDKNYRTDITYNLRNTINFSDVFYSGYMGDALNYYSLMKMKIEEIIDTFTPAPSIRFNRYTNTIHVDESLHTRFVIDDIVVYEAYIILDPGTYGNVFSDRMFLNLASAYTQKQWGLNLLKFEGIKLFSGNVVNGKYLYETALQDIEKYEEEIKTTATPSMFSIG